MSTEEPEYELLFPFVTVVSKGGPHDDEAFTRGFECGRIDAQLMTFNAFGSAGPREWDVMVHHSIVEQVDLILGARGWHIEARNPIDMVAAEWVTLLCSRDLPAEEALEP